LPSLCWLPFCDRSANARRRNVTLAFHFLARGTTNETAICVAGHVASPERGPARHPPILPNNKNKPSRGRALGRQPPRMLAAETLHWRFMAHIGTTNRRAICLSGPLPPDGSVARHGTRSLCPSPRRGRAPAVALIIIWSAIDRCARRHRRQRGRGLHGEACRAGGRDHAADLSRARIKLRARAILATRSGQDRRCPH
jgi:hypothetical protein